MTSAPSSALIEAYLQKRAMLVRYFTGRTRNAEQAEDIVQALYLKIERLPPDYAADNPTAFLFRAGTHILLNEIRTRRRAHDRDQAWTSSQSDQMGDELVAPMPSPEAAVSARQQLQAALCALEELPPRTQDIFRLHRLERLTQAEVAQRLSLSKSSVEKHLYAALKHLVARLGP
ncbi:sigma-70 family RNA polymerase sigma factor [Asticcacaulis sp. DXS10W]|uniref:Sigma-70 family RNA polymerase sigma factor n=1 Tax=Asticcacaulis currens TaxID=2984210 RepID=A0ABT5IDV9_9CAUL|nr:sigma-70 family RNA polymerase sigma factor [Asticcacaulis currens]MDC7694344.1 sigma-70 family RNA polymerase sigma factor [Asticcacaulis currens]